MPNIPIINFNSGEVTPKIDARVDVEKHSSSCRHLENFIPLIYGCVERRPGTRFIYDAMANFGGAGVNDPDPTKIQIDTIEELQLIGNDVDYPLDGDYELMCDLDASDTENWNSGAGWDAIGDSSTSFTGTFDGRYHTISSLFIDRSSTDYIGLFGYVKGGTIENLRLLDFDYTARASIGGLVGRIQSGTAAVIIRKCYTQGVIKPQHTNYDNTGGFIGYIDMVTSANSITIEESGADVDITPLTNQSYVGGFIGTLSGSSGGDTITVQNCYAIGAILGAPGTLNTRYGGFIGRGGNSGTNNIINCYSSGAVPSCNQTYMRGGFLGEDMNSNISITSCYYDATLSGCTWSDGGTSKTTAQMKKLATFVDWNVTTIWSIDEDVSSPDLLLFWSPSGVARIIPFIYSATVAYKVELGLAYMRFSYGDSLVENVDSETLMLNTPYLEADLFELKYKQRGDVMWIVHEDYLPRKLTRTSATAFSLDVIDFKKGPFLIRNDLIDPDESSTATMTSSVTALAATGTLTCSTAFFDDDHVGALFKLVHPRADTIESGSVTGTTEEVMGDTFGATGISVKGTFHFNTHGTWAATVVLQRNENAAGWEDYRTYLGDDDRNVQYAGNEEADNVKYRMNVTEHAGGGTIKGDITVDDSMQTGIVKVLAITSTIVAVIEVLKTVTSTAATRRWAEGAWSAYRGYPSSVTFYEDRCVFGGMSEIQTQV